MPNRSRALSTIGSIYVLIPLIVGAAGALAYYSYWSAEKLAQSGERSIISTTEELADIEIARVEKDIADSDDAVFAAVDPLDLANFKTSSAMMEYTFVLDDHLQILPGGNRSKRTNASEVATFRLLFEQKIKPALDLRSLAVDQIAHLHREFDGQEVLLSYTRRDVNGKDYYIVVEDDLAYFLTDIFPEVFAGVERTRLYQIVDDNENVVFGHFHVPARYMITRAFPTLPGWTLRMAPAETPALISKQTARRGSGSLLIILSAATIFVGLAILTVAVRTERMANRLKSDFIANVSHELKTPLSLIRMFGELLATGRAKSADTALEYAQIITRESERLSRLIDNVLDFARIERGKAAYTFATGDLAEVLSRGLDVYRYRLEREGMKLTVDIPDDFPPVRIDENAMTLVLLNLVDNAVKYASEGKALHVSLAERGDRVLLMVRDRGPGIGPDERDRIFDRFYRAHSVRTRPIRGSGIGLSLVKHIAEAHNGGVYVESEMGKGSTFTVWLPKDPGESLPA